MEPMDQKWQEVNKNMQRIKDAVLRRYLMAKSDERGMEVAQVVIILALVVGALAAFGPGLLNAITGAGNDAVRDINNLTR
jgi:glutamate synthase domain-containing protein 3